MSEKTTIDRVVDAWQLIAKGPDTIAPVAKLAAMSVVFRASGADEAAVIGAIKAETDSDPELRARYRALVKACQRARKRSP
jgi:hypothetical protein